MMRRPTGSWPQMLILLVILSTVIGLRAEVPEGWATNYAAALPQAAKEQKPVLLFFTASWCGPCKLMVRATLPDTNVQTALEGLVRVAVDIDDHTELASQYGIDAVPTFVMLSPGGDEVRRATGFQAAADFRQWLASGVGAAKAALAQQGLVQEELADIDRYLASTNSEDLRRGAAILFRLCPERNEATLRSVVERLKKLGAAEPSVLLDGMADSHLATRIQVANVLRGQLGEKFDVDAWSEPAARTDAIRKWRKLLVTRN